MIGVRDDELLGETDTLAPAQGPGGKVRKMSASTSSERLSTTFLVLGPPSSGRTPPAEEMRPPYRGIASINISKEMSFEEKGR